MVLEVQRLADRFREEGHIAEANVLAAQAELFRAAGTPDMLSKNTILSGDSGINPTSVEANGDMSIASELSETSLPPQVGTVSGVEIGNRNLITVNEAAELRGCHPTYIKKLLRDGKITGEKLGHNLYVDQASLENYRSSRTK